MDFRQSLAKRIVIVFALMSAFVAGVFAAGILATVHIVEYKFTSADLGSGLNRLLHQHDTAAWNHRPGKDELFFAQGESGDMALDPALATLAPGFQEIEYQGQSYYAVSQVVDGRQYVLLRNQESFKQRERVLFAAVAVGFVLSILLAVLSGRLLAHRVMAPVIRLARQVRHRDRLLDIAPPLHPDYTVDEVGELALSFDKTLSRLRDALSREKLFTSDVSHELRTPLTVLASSCELLLCAPSLDQHSAAQVDRIARSSDEMRQLVNTFLTLARASDARGKGVQASLKEVADGLVDIWGRLIREKGLEFVYDSEHATSQLYDLTLLQSVMGNLLRNAWHYTHHGFIRLTLNEHGFSVEDSGIGISDDKREAMFQPVIRGEQSQGEGVGLGLSLVQRICGIQGWRVELTPREPNGCCFSVDLAVAK
ncbi:sensor histidine kinase [Pseudomonas syringae]|uniref:sensor histidine kinase n=1 Tax=Pseudomonas syringae TaxID=317 RepID=UPI001F3A51B0|nr:HAMP domain-containing sensor histidine kinase [Pseudomonas syringae]MBL3831967.1 sensor histidine kinase [Pseudomonas syringae pv. theae]MBL3836224.1 sensor histidine kinase [Pseudomonas syringae pv. theae]MBL3868370.1 sensor histidine kinase [Pseudomonas syringae pv. theae]